VKDIREHKRILETFTGPLERPVLRWLAERQPPWVTPDILTGVGMLGALLVFASYGLTTFNPAFLWLANLGFVINWYGDSLDGTLARVRKIERPQYGFYIDHTLDAFSEGLIFLGLGLSPYVRFDLAALAFAAYLMLSVEVFVRTCVSGEFVLSYGRLGPTEIRLLAMLANTLIFFTGIQYLQFFSVRMMVYDWMVCIVIVVLLYFFVVSTIKQAMVLSRLDRKSP
jgi:archaetidylinositol phosphate synthase